MSTTTSPLKYATFVTNRPWTSLFLVLLIPVILSGISMPNFDLNDLEGWDVRHGDSSKNYDAWTKAEELTFSYDPNKDIYNPNNENKKSMFDVKTEAVNIDQDPQRSIDSNTNFQIYYQSLTTGNMLTSEGLQMMHEMETSLTTHASFVNNCLLHNVSNVWQCKPPISIVVGAESPIANEATAAAPNSLPTITQTTHIELLQWMHSTRAIYSNTVINTFDTTTNSSSSVRSIFQFGLPIAGYDTALTNEIEQKKTIKKSIVQKKIATLAESIANALPDKYHICTLSCDATHQYRILFDYSGLSGVWAMRQLSADGPLAGLSFAFVLIVMTLHTRSFAIASVGMLQILLSFPSTYFFYRIVLNIHHFGTLQVLAVYVILGIGADDIFVLYDAFMQAPGQGAAKLSWALKRAVSAMAVTSLTTFAAFVVTALSPITNIKVFGIFAALLVATNFLLCCLLTPILITLVHQNKCCPCCFKEKKINHEGKNEKKKKEDDGMKEDPEKQTQNKEENQKNSIELRLVERFFHDTLTPGVLRYQWLVVLLGIVLIVVFGLFAIQLAPSDKGIGDIWPETHTVAVVSDLKSGIFLRGEARYERINIVFGINGIDRTGTDAFDPTDKGTLIWDKNFDLSNIHTQTSMVELCNTLKTNDILKLKDIECLMSDLITWRKYFGINEFPITNKIFFYGNLTNMLRNKYPTASAAALPISILMKMQSSKKEDVEELVKVMSLGPRHLAMNSVRFATENSAKASVYRMTLQLNHDWYASVTLKTQERKEINNILDLQYAKKEDNTKDEVTKGGLASKMYMGRGTMTSGGHVWMDTQLSLVSNSSFGLIVAFCLAFLVLLVATSSLIVSMTSLFCIVGIVAMVIGIMVMMGRDLGFMESICVTVIVGLAVDYVVHIGIAYTEHYHLLLKKNQNRKQQKLDRRQLSHSATTGAMTDLGVSVLGGATSSFGSALFLLMCVIKYLNQFGEFMALVIITSLFFSCIIYPGFLASSGHMMYEIQLKNMCCKKMCNKGGARIEKEEGGDGGVEMSSSIQTKGKVNEKKEDVDDDELSAQDIMNWSKEKM